MGMLEKAARAASEEAARSHEDTDWPAVARAVLLAIREPGLEAAMMGGTVIPLNGLEATDCAERAFTAMIDAILTTDATKETK